jgi:hypothetical protein
MAYACGKPFFDLRDERRPKLAEIEAITVAA